MTIAGHLVPNGELDTGSGESNRIETVHLTTFQRNRVTRAVSLFFFLFRFLSRRQAGFDLIFCSSFKDATLVVALLKRIGLLNLPLVVRCEGYGDSGDALFLKSMPGTRWLVFLLNAGCEAVNNLSPRIETELTAVGLHTRLVRQIPNGVPLPRLEIPVLFPEDKPRGILFVGRLVPQKGVSDLLAAVADLVQRRAVFQVNVVGTGPLLKALKKQARDLGIEERVKFHGRIDPGQVPYFYRDSHFLVLPSRQEAFGMAAVEAMSHGRPVVVTRSGGPEYYVDRLVGRVCPAGDVFALADAMQEMIDMPLATLQEMGLKARERVEARFNIEDTSNRFLELFYEVAL